MQRKLKLIVFTSGPMSPVNRVLFERLARERNVRLAAVVVDDYLDKRPRKSLPLRILRGLKKHGPRWLKFKLASMLGAGVKRVGLGLFERFHPRTGPDESYQRFQRESGVPVHRVDDIHGEESLALIRSYQPDLGAIVGTRILRESVLDIPLMGTLNIHKRKVPEYRGGGPVGYWEVLAGESEIGVTIHYATAGVDEGPVLNQDTIPIEPCDTLRSLEIKAGVLGVELYHRTIREIATGSEETVDQDLTAGETYRAPPEHEAHALEQALVRRTAARMPSAKERRSGFTWWRMLAQYLLLSPLLLRGRKRLLGRGQAPVTMFFYHVVSNRPVNHMCVPLERFVEEVEFLRRYYRVVSLDEAVARVRSGKNTEHVAAITFDDGYADNAWAAKYLSLFDVPATFFVSTGHMLEGHAFEHDRSKGFDDARPMTEAEVRALAQKGFTIGSHAVNHEDFAHLDADTADRVLVESREKIREAAGEAPGHFSFPKGQPHNIPEQALALAAKHYTYLHAAYGGYNFPRAGARFFLRNANPMDVLDLAMIMDGYTGLRRCLGGDAWGVKSYALPSIKDAPETRAGSASRVPEATFAVEES